MIAKDYDEYEPVPYDVEIAEQGYDMEVDYRLPLAGNQPDNKLLKKAHMLIDLLFPNSIEIGLSPRDHILNMGPHNVINTLIKNSIRRLHGLNHLFLVGEWAPDTKRWHYHGIISIKDIASLDKIRRRLEIDIGRVEVNNIRNEQCLEDYIFKVYHEPIIMNTIQPFTEDSYLLLVKKTPQLLNE